MPFHRIFLPFFCALLPLLTACQAPKETTALSLLRTMTALESTLPAGDIYLLPDSLSLALLGDEAAHISPSNAPVERVRIADQALLGSLLSAPLDTQKAQPIATETPSQAPSESPQKSPNDRPESALLADGAWRLSTADSPCEWIVLRAISRAHTDEIAALLLDRLDLIRRQYKGTAHEALAEQGEVVVLGPFVLLIVSPNTTAAIAAARRAMS